MQAVERHLPRLDPRRATRRSTDSRDFYVPPALGLEGVDRSRHHQAATGLELYATACGWTLARAHARSGDRIAIASYLGKADVFDRAVAEFSRAYADQNDKDHAALRQAADDGRIKIEEGL